MDSFAFMIIDQSNIVSVFERIPFKSPREHFRYVDPVEILSVVQNNNLRYNKYEKVHISLDHSAFTFVPSELYRPEAWYDYLTYLSSDVRKDDVVTSSGDDGSVCVYSYPLAVRKLLSTLYPTTQVHHLSQSIISFLRREVTDDAVLFSLVYGADQYLLAFDRKQLVLVNRYQAPTVEDQMYYILAACKHAHLHPQKVSIKITGSLEQVDPLKDQLTRYFIHVSPIEWRNGWRLPLSVKNPMELFEFYCIHHAHRQR